MHWQAIFLDREGILTPKLDEGEFVLRDEHAVLADGVPQALAPLAATDTRLFIVSNQSCVERGLLSTDEMWRLNALIVHLLKQAGVTIEDSRLCPHTDAAACSCRKPNPGMILDLCAANGLDPMRCAMIGDAIRDVQAGSDAGCGASCLVTTKSDAPLPPRSFTFPTLGSAVSWLLT